MSRVKFPATARRVVLAFLLGFGTHKVSTTGAERTKTNPYGFRDYDCGNVVRTEKLVKKFGRAAVMKTLRDLEAEKLVVLKRGGRHAGWYLTEAGVNTARAQKAEIDAAVRRVKP